MEGQKLLKCGLAADFSTFIHSFLHKYIKLLQESLWQYNIKEQLAFLHVLHDRKALASVCNHTCLCVSIKNIYVAIKGSGV